jgi:hypothetical protein
MGDRRRFDRRVVPHLNHRSRSGYHAQAGPRRAGHRSAQATSGGAALEKHPAIHKAIVALFDAKRDLERADHDFGGHRKQAIEDIDKAVAQLKLALQHDKK